MISRVFFFTFPGKTGSDTPEEPDGTAGPDIAGAVSFQFDAGDSDAGGEGSGGEGEGGMDDEEVAGSGKDNGGVTGGESLELVGNGRPVESVREMGGGTRAAESAAEDNDIEAGEEAGESEVIGETTPAGPSEEDTEEENDKSCVEGDSLNIADSGVGSGEVALGRKLRPGEGGEDFVIDPEPGDGEEGGGEECGGKGAGMADKDGAGPGDDLPGIAKESGNERLSGKIQEVSRGSILAIRRAWRPPSKEAVSQASTIRIASSEETIRSPMEIILASLCFRARVALWVFQQTAQRIPRILLAAMASPLPEPPKMTPSSASPAATARAAG